MRKLIGLFALLTIWGLQVCFAQTPVTITGTVTDKDGEPMIGVTVRLKSKPTEGVTTNVNGQFAIKADNTNETLLFTYIGMKDKNVALKPGVTNYKVVMEDSQTDLGAVVVNAGIIQRDKIGFTGSVKTVTQEELRSIGSINVIQSLRSLDPSFVIAENNLRGSDPNTMANITLRGGSTMNITSTFDDMSVNPNQPLFVLDGFPTTLQIVNDIDINRIESITILKDAGSTAIYGAQGGNGVIIIETVKPKPGEVRVSYNGNLQLSVADLSVYNLMNAEEKLRFEVLSQRYGNLNDWSGNRDKIEDYNNRLERVRMGVNTYWLKAPIRTGFTQDHSLNISGGEAGFLYQVGTSYRNEQGVMKESGRQTFGGNMMLQYRHEKFNVRNHLTVSVTNGHDGTWTTGNSFEKFAQANPYYTMRNDDGTIPMNLDNYQPNLGFENVIAPNPYYNASLNSKNDKKFFSVTNNTSVEWTIRPNLRWTSALQLWVDQNENVNFKDPGHTDYYSSNYTQQGEYTFGSSNLWKYSANTRLVYTLSLQEAHNLSFIGRVAISSSQNKGNGYILTGFPKGIKANPAYAYGYKENSRPAYSESVSREVNFLFTSSYNYLYRYLFDFTLSSDGTTAFGRNNKFQTNWSIGAGWNVDKEAFAQDWTWMQAMKLRGSYGKNGNQSADNISTNVYSYYSGSDMFGAGAYVSRLANPDLKWQIVTKSSAGIDITLLNNRLNTTVDVYRTETDPMVVSIEQKPSAGAPSYPVNLGHLTTKGIDFSASYQIIKDIPRNILLSVRMNAGTYKSTYGGFAESLNKMNNAYKTATGDNSYQNNLNLNSLVQFRDGGSPDDLWAVRSLGIDPGTGREVYLDKNGTPTFDYSADNRVVIANRNPDLRGTFGFTFRYKELTANFNFGYSLGGYDFNRALYSKVENIANTNIVYNQDKRALYDRWKNPGDVTQFKAITEVYRSARWTNTPLSSRFIQRNNYLSGQDAKLSWDLTKKEWIKTVGLEDLTVSVSYSDLFYLSTMKRERGIDYPFARSVTFGISAMF